MSRLFIFENPLFPPFSPFDERVALYWQECNDIAEMHLRLGQPGFGYQQRVNTILWLCVGRFRETDRGTLLGNCTEQMNDGFTAAHAMTAGKMTREPLPVIKVR